MSRTLKEVIELTEFEEGTNKAVYVKMADAFDLMLPDSLESDQFMLANMCGETFNHAQWSEFLNIPQVEVWVESQTYSRVKAKARKAQGTMDMSVGQNAKTILAIVDKKEGDDTKRIVITRIPAKSYVKP